MKNKTLTIVFSLATLITISLPSQAYLIKDTSTHMHSGFGFWEMQKMFVATQKEQTRARMRAWIGSNRFKAGGNFGNFGGAQKSIFSMKIPRLNLFGLFNKPQNSEYNKPDTQPLFPGDESLTETSSEVSSLSTGINMPADNQPRENGAKLRTTSVFEPETFALMALGLVGLFVVRRERHS